MVLMGGQGPSGKIMVGGSPPFKKKVMGGVCGGPPPLKGECHAFFRRRTRIVSHGTSDVNAQIHQLPKNEAGGSAGAEGVGGYPAYPLYTMGGGSDHFEKLREGGYPQKLQEVNKNRDGPAGYAGPAEPVPFLLPMTSRDKSPGAPIQPAGFSCGHPTRQIYIVRQTKQKTKCGR